MKQWAHFYLSVMSATGILTSDSRATQEGEKRSVMDKEVKAIVFFINPKINCHSEPEISEPGVKPKSSDPHQQAS